MSNIICTREFTSRCAFATISFFFVATFITTARKCQRVIYMESRYGGSEIEIVLLREEKKLPVNHPPPKKKIKKYI